jgi:hypothetical protein
MKTRRTIRLFAIAAVMLAAALAWAQKDFPSGWGEPTWNQLKLKVQADFDGDGRPDTAQVLTDINNRAVAVMAYTSSNQRWAKLDSDAISELPHWHVGAIDPGSYTLTCAPDDKHCIAGPVKLDHPAITIVVDGKPDEVFYWDATMRRFEHGLLSK